MTVGEVVVRVAFAAAALSAWRLAHVGLAPAHRVVAAALGAAFLCDVARPLLTTLGAPLLLRRGLFLAFPALSLWCTGAVLLPITRRPGRQVWAIAVAAGWALAVVVVGVFALPQGSPEYERCARLLRTSATGMELGVVVAFLIRRELPPTTTHQVALLLVAGDVSELAGPWVWPLVAKAWDLARWQWALVYAVVWSVQVRKARWIRRTLARRSEPGSSPSASPSS